MDRAYCASEHAVSSPAASIASANTRVSIHNGMARLSWPEWLVKYRKAQGIIILMMTIIIINVDV